MPQAIHANGAIHGDSLFTPLGQFIDRGGDLVILLAMLAVIFASAIR